VPSLYLTTRFFLIFGAIAVLFVFAYFLPWLLVVAQAAFVIGIAGVIADLIIVSRASRSISASRVLPAFFSLGEENPVSIHLDNVGRLPVHMRIIDEVPVQLQLRDQVFRTELRPGQMKEQPYTLRPVVRGLYFFGRINVFVSSVIGLVERRLKLGSEESVKVYPSVMQMKRFELRMLNRTARFQGVKRMRKIGHSYEFEQIKTYVRGDDYRSVNWKATGRRGGDLMVNQYEDERAQQVYILVDKSRSMKLPFNGLSLMDHAINTALVIANVALQKTDRPGLITFAEKIDSMVRAQSSSTQLQRILESLYRQKESELEANFETLYSAVRRYVKGRSLLILMTNFETLHNMERALPLLRRLSRLHVLVVVFFENVEIADFTRQTAENLEDIYNQTIARKFLSEKKRMVTELENYGIKALLTRPEELTVRVINAYLELKARGMI